MPGPSLSDTDYVQFLNNEEKLEVIREPGVIPTDPGLTSDLGGRRTFPPNTKSLVILREVKKEDKLGPNLPNTSNASQQTNTAVDVPGDVAKVDFDRSLALTVYVQCDSIRLYQNSFDPAATSPLAAAVVAGPPPRGGAVSICQLEYGHEGTIISMIFDVPEGGIAKATVVGSAARVKTRLAPKYYFAQDVGAAPAVRSYFIDVGLTLPMNTYSFNVLPPNLMRANGFANPFGYTSRGWIAEGTCSTNNPTTLPKRRFYGSIAAGAAKAMIVQCPVAWNATSVILQGGLFNAAGADTPVAFTITTIQGQTLGPFPANTEIPLIQGADIINVYTTAAAASEVFFELAYILG